MKKAEELLRAEFKENFGNSGEYEFHYFKRGYPDYYKIIINALSKALHMSDVSNIHFDDKILEILENIVTLLKIQRIGRKDED